MTPPVPQDGRQRERAFTLIELLVVIGIIGLLMFIAVPAFKGFGQGNVMTAAQQQLRDDLGFARLQAIRNRSPVYMVFFMPPYRETPEQFSSDLAQVHSAIRSLPMSDDYQRQYREMALRAFTNTFPRQYTAYALFTESSLGEQPGIKRLRYLTEWRPLPDGALFPTNGFELILPSWVTGISNQIVLTNLNARSFPFPIAPERDIPNNPIDTKDMKLRLPALAFDPQGRLFNFDQDGRPIGNGATLADRYVAVSAGSVQLTRMIPTRKGATPIYDFQQPADVVETPRRNYTNQLVRVSALTGRAKPLKPVQ